MYMNIMEQQMKDCNEVPEIFEQVLQLEFY